MGPEGLASLKRRGVDFVGVPFQPRANEPGCNPQNPLVVWAGDAQLTNGGYFTFGDLVALYGDLRRIITCDSTNTAFCGLGDLDTGTWTVERRIALRDIAQGWLFWGDRAGNPTISRWVVLRLQKSLYIYITKKTRNNEHG